ncbi:MAG: hypothetical protein HY902_18965 [Deltaproteobacteria bacterium]|nr:hypothetical protein [Deltaproteobacteria bacterium]
MDGSFVPFYALAVTTFVVLLVALFLAASKILFQQRVNCPADGRPADVLFEQSKRSPWAKAGTLDVVQCSLLPGEKVTCAKGCLGCGKVGD